MNLKISGWTGLWLLLRLTWFIKVPVVAPGALRGKCPPVSHPRKTLLLPWFRCAQRLQCCCFPCHFSKLRGAEWFFPSPLSSDADKTTVSCLQALGSVEPGAWTRDTWKASGWPGYLKEFKSIWMCLELNWDEGIEGAIQVCQKWSKHAWQG